MRLPEPPILVITDRRQARRPLEEVAEAAFAGGCRWLSLREKDLDPAARLALLRRLVGIGMGWSASVMVHGDIEAARAAGAAGVHLPAGDSPAEARARLGRHALIGCSAHGAEELPALAAAGADYATVSPIFASASKPGYGPALGVGVFANAPLPLLALGGITALTAPSCLAAGAAGIAVMGPVMTADDPQAMLTALVKAVGAALAALPHAGHSGASSP